MKTLIIENVIDERITTPTLDELKKPVTEIKQSFFAPKILKTEIGELELVCITEENSEIIPYYKRIF